MKTPTTPHPDHRSAARAATRRTNRSFSRLALLIIAPLALAVASVLPSTVQPTLATLQPRQPDQPAVSQALAARMAALRPEYAEDYLLLAEEVADTAATPPDLRLARQLYTLALILDTNPASNPTSSQRRASSVAASACYGLAELTRSPTERNWLLATAGAVRPHSASDRVRPASLTDATPNLASAINLSDAISLARAGEGKRADILLKRPGTTELLNFYQRALDDRGYFNSASRIKRWITDWPTCQECANRRIVPRTEAGKSVTHVCGTCRGNPGPELEINDLINQVRFQSALLSGIQSSWSAALLIDGGEPAREPDPAEVARTYGVDPEATRWLGGRWVKPK